MLNTKWNIRNSVAKHIECRDSHLVSLIIHDCSKLMLNLLNAEYRVDCKCCPMDVVLKHFYEYVTKFLKNHIEDSNYGIITIDSIGIFLNCLNYFRGQCLLWIYWCYLLLNTYRVWVWVFCKCFCYASSWSDLKKYQIELSNISSLAHRFT